jgi:hypothetical protein
MYCRLQKLNSLQITLSTTANISEMKPMSLHIIKRMQLIQAEKCKLGVIACSNLLGTKI